MQNNSEIRGLLSKRGIKPEELPVEEDIKILERRVKKNEKRIVNSSKARSKLFG